MPGGQKVRGWRVGALQHDLAAGKSQTQCAAMYGCTQSSISEFAKKYATEIQSIKDSTRTLLDDLWIADKQKRIAGYQEDIERIESMLDAEREAVDGSVFEGDARAAEREESSGPEKKRGRPRTTGGIPLAELVRTLQAARRAVAEEMGDLPQRLKVEGGGEPVKHVIEGVDLGDLT